MYKIILMAIFLGATMVFGPRIALAGANAEAAGQLQCGPFTQAALPPAPQTDPEAIERFRQIKREVAAGSHRILFLGDSLTQKWNRMIWQQDPTFRDALNAGVNGDRTEHLLWRLKNGDLDGQHPEAVVLLIGTNDIGRNRPAQMIAEGIGDILKLLRTRLPDARILLLGILPRSESPFSHRRYQVREVNQLIRKCGDGEHVFYADVGSALLDSRDRLSRAISPDGVHLSQDGYARLTRQIDIKLRQILDAGPPAVGRHTQPR